MAGAQDTTRTVVGPAISVLAIVQVALFGLALLLSSACGGETKVGAALQSDGCVEEVTGLVDADGGVLIVDNPRSPVRGVSVTFPAAALSSQTSASLGYCNKSARWRAGRPSNIYISLRVDGVSAFREAVTISIPYAASADNEMPIPYLVEDNDRLRVAQMESIDPEKARFVISTWGPGIYSWVYSR